MTQHAYGPTCALASRRDLLLLGAFGLAAPAWAAADPAATRKQGNGPRPWRMLVNEAVTGETNFFVLTSRYRGFADYVTDNLRGKHPVGVEPIVDIKRFMLLAQGTPKPELVFGKSVNQLAKLVRDNGFQPLVRRADPYKAAFIVAKDSPIRTLADVKTLKARIVMPDEFAATTAVARAELRRQNIGSAEITHTRYQEAVAQQVKNGFAQIGVVNPTIAKQWAQEGGRVIAETQPVVNWSVLASPEVPPEACGQLRDAFLAMPKHAPAVMTSLGVKQWAPAERQDYLALLDYTKE